MRSKPARTDLPPEPVWACAGELIDVLPGVMNAMRVAMRRHVSGGLSVPQFRCLNFVARRPGSSLGEVAAFMGISLPTASATVDRLAKAGLMDAVSSATDRRRSELRVTAAGLALLEGMRELARGELARQLADLSPAQLASLSESMALLKHAFGKAPLPTELLAEPSPGRRRKTG